MPKTVTLAELRTQVRFRAGFENARRITDARLNEVINSAVQGIWDLLLQHRPNAYVREQNPAPATAIGTEIVALAADFYRLIAVEVLEGGTYYRLRPHNVLERGIINRATTATPTTMTYRFQAAAGNDTGPALYIAPTPSRVWPLRVSYLPVRRTLVGDADVFDGVNGYDDLVITEAIIILKMRESMPMDSWVRQADRLKAAIVSAATDLDVGQPFTLGGPERMWTDDPDGMDP